MTDEGFARADKETVAAPLELSLSLAGTPDKQMLSIAANKSITPTKLDFLTSSGTYITGAEPEVAAGSTITIPLDHQKITELFNAPRPDKNYADHAGPAALRLMITANRRRYEAVLPILLEPVSINHTQWLKVLGSQSYTLT